MDIAELSGSGAASIGTQIDASMLSALQNLDRNTMSELFASIGIGTGVDTYA